MDAKHTPGPWHIEHRLWLGGSSFAEGPGVFSIQDENTETVICDRRTPWPERADEMAANASLIVAAPELLEALLTLVTASSALIAHLKASDRLRPCFNLPAIEAAQAAIAKALGSAS